MFPGTYFLQIHNLKFLEVLQIVSPPGNSNSKPFWKSILYPNHNNPALRAKDSLRTLITWFLDLPPLPRKQNQDCEGEKGEKNFTWDF